MYAHPLVLIHGYGVRGAFWNALRAELTDSFDRIETPDMNIPDVNAGVAAVGDICRETRAGAAGPVTLVGHSLGGVLAALAARDLDPDTVSHLVVIASPFGNHVGRAFGPITRLRFALGLMGRSELRRRFFGRAVPEDVQNAVFATAADESSALKALGRQRRWFHTDAFPAGVPQRSLVIGSDADRIVHGEEVRGFATALDAEVTVFPRGEDVGHDDFAVFPPVAKRTAALIRGFVHRGNTGFTGHGGV